MLRWEIEPVFTAVPMERRWIGKPLMGENACEPARSRRGTVALVAMYRGRCGGAFSTGAQGLDEPYAAIGEQ